MYMSVTKNIYMTNIYIICICIYYIYILYLDIYIYMCIKKRCVSLIQSNDFDIRTTSSVIIFNYNNRYSFFKELL